MKTFPVSIRKASEYFDAHFSEQISIDSQVPAEGQQIIYLHRSFADRGIRRTYDPYFSPSGSILVRLSVNLYGNPYCRKEDIAYWLPVTGPMI